MSVPTLLVGVGGAGLAIVKKVYNRATPEQRKSIAFVVFDTDVNELSAISESKMNIHAIQISATMTVGEYLKYDDNARNKWFPVNNVLNTKVLTEGAGQVRAISRLAFNTALVQGKMAPLDTAIAELYKLRGNTLSQAPRVIITGSLRCRSACISGMICRRRSSRAAPLSAASSCCRKCSSMSFPATASVITSAAMPMLPSARLTPS